MLHRETSARACDDTQTYVFHSETQRRTMAFVKKLQSSLCEVGGPRSFEFETEKRLAPFSFFTKCVADHTLSVQNPLVQRHFMSKIDVCGAMGLSQISRTRDLANPLGVEALRLRFIIS